MRAVFFLPCLLVLLIGVGFLIPQDATATPALFPGASPIPANDPMKGVLDVARGQLLEAAGAGAAQSRVEVYRLPPTATFDAVSSHYIAQLPGWSEVSRQAVPNGGAVMWTDRAGHIVTITVTALPAGPGQGPTNYLLVSELSGAGATP